MVHPLTGLASGDDLSPKNMAGAERLPRDLAHTEREIAYYLDRLDTIDEQVELEFADQPAHRKAFAGAIASLKRRKDRLARRQEELAKRAEKVLVFGEPDAKPMGYAYAPKLPSYNLQSVVRKSCSIGNWLRKECRIRPNGTG